MPSPSSAPHTCAATLETLQQSMDKLKATEQQLEAMAQKYERKMQSSRKWNYFAMAMAIVVCIVSWINHASAWLRWGVLPVVFFMVLFFEGMRRLLGITMQSSMRQLKIQISTLEKQMAEAQAPAPTDGQATHPTQTQAQ